MSLTFTGGGHIIFSAGEHLKLKIKGFYPQLFVKWRGYALYLN